MKDKEIKIIEEYFKQGEEYLQSIIDTNPIEDWYLNDEEEDREEIHRSLYLGSVLNIAPSGKYYMPWTTNQTAEDELKDHGFYEGMDKTADKYGYWIESGMGDALDLYICGILESDNNLNIDDYEDMPE